MKKIVFVAVDGGAYGTLLPVYERFLSEKYYNVSWVTQEGSKAAGRLQGNYDFSCYQKNKIDFSEIALVVAGASGLKAGAELYCAQEAMKQGVPVVKVLDFWGTGQPHEKGFVPDLLCVLDQPSAEYEARMRNMPIRNIRATGDPKMDVLVKVDKSEQASHRNRETLGIKDEYFFVFTGPSSHERVMEVFPAVVEAIKGGRVEVLIDEVSHCEIMPNQVTLGTLWHPSHSGRKEKDGKVIYENKQDIDQCYQLLQDARIPFISDADSRTMLSNPEIFVAADLVIGVTSTETVVACYLRKQTLNIIYPGGVNYKDILEPKGMKAIPTVECGAALVAKTPQEVNRIINSLYGDYKPATYRFDSYLYPQEKMQEKYYNLDGKNTERVVNAIKEFL